MRPGNIFAVQPDLSVLQGTDSGHAFCKFDLTVARNSGDTEYLSTPHIKCHTFQAAGASVSQSLRVLDL